MKASEFERALLESASTDAPSPERKRANRDAVMRAAGLATAAGVAAISTTAATTTSAAKAMVASASKALLWIKISSVVVILGGIAGTTVLATRSPEAANVPVVTSSVPSSSTSTTREGPSSPSVEEHMLADVAPSAEPVRDLEKDLPSVAVTSKTPVNPSRAVTKPTSSSDKPSSDEARAPMVDPLATEVSLLETARRCLDASDFKCASANLDAHRTRFARGALRDEATVLAIDLARAQGNMAKARELAQHLLDEDPAGPYASRAKAVLASP